MDPTAAARIIESLDLELARRQAKRDAAEDAAWAEEFSGDDIILTAKRLERDWDRKSRSPFFQPLSMADYAKQLFAIATKVDREEDRGEDEAAGVEHEFVRVTMVRPQYKTGPPKVAKAAKVSRTEAARAAVAAPSGKVAGVVARTDLNPASGDVGWRFGTVVRFDQIALSGTIVFRRK